MRQPIPSGWSRRKMGECFLWAEMGCITKNERGVRYGPIQCDFGEGKAGPSGEKLQKWTDI